MNPWSVGLTSTAAGLILLAIFVRICREDKHHEEVMKQFKLLGSAIDDSFEAQSNYAATRFDQLNQTVLLGKGVASVSSVRGRGNNEPA